MFGQIFKQWFWDCYDALGRLLLLNLALGMVFFTVTLMLFGWLEAVAEALAPEQLFLVTAMLFLVSWTPMTAVWLAGMLQFGRESTETNDPPLRSFARGVRRSGFRMLRFVGLVYVLVVVLWANIFFYVFQGGFGGLSGSLPGIVAGLFTGLSFWGLVILFAVLVHGAPLVVRREAGARAGFKAGLLLTMKHPILSLGVVLFLGSLWVIGSALKLVGLIVFGFSFTAMFVNSVHDVVIATMEKAEKIAGEREARGEAKAPVSWKQIRAIESQEEEEQMDAARYDRTFRDILKPWEI